MLWEPNSEAVSPRSVVVHFLHLRMQGNVLQEHQKAFEELFLNTDSLWEQAEQGPTVGDIAIPHSI
jgi:hypothetical protein